MQKRILVTFFAKKVNKKELLANLESISCLKDSGRRSYKKNMQKRTLVTFFDEKNKKILKNPTFPANLESISRLKGPGSRFYKKKRSKSIKKKDSVSQLRNR